jgi:hypothetical protein
MNVPRPAERTQDERRSYPPWTLSTLDPSAHDLQRQAQEPKEKHERKIQGLSLLSHGEPQIWALGRLGGGVGRGVKNAAEAQCVEACKTVRDVRFRTLLIIIKGKKNKAISVTDRGGL